MLTIKIKTNKGKQIINVPEEWAEVTTRTFQKLIKEWDGKDWIQLFSILSGINIDYVLESKDGKLEGTFYKCISFVFEQVLDFEKLPVPKTLTLSGRPITIPKNIGRLSIGQAIQARKSLESTEGEVDIREGISIITAIYLQPLLDGKQDHLRAIEIENEILEMPITQTFAIGFFLLTKLSESGKKPESAWSLIKRLLTNVERKLRS